MYKKIFIICMVGHLGGYLEAQQHMAEQQAPEESHDAALARSRQEALQALTQARELLARASTTNLAALDTQEREQLQESLQRHAEELNRLRSTNISGAQRGLANYAQQLRMRAHELRAPEPNNGSQANMLPPPAFRMPSPAARTLTNNFNLVPLHQPPLPLQPAPVLSRWHTAPYHAAWFERPATVVRPDEDGSDVESESGNTSMASLESWGNSSVSTTSTPEWQWDAY